MAQSCVLRGLGAGVGHGEDAGWEVGCEAPCPTLCLRDVTLIVLLCREDSEAKQLRFTETLEMVITVVKILFKPLMWVCEVDITPIFQRN